MVAASWVSVLVAQSVDRVVTQPPTSDTGIPSLTEAKNALGDVWGGIGYATAQRSELRIL
jgi:hypothetical protein